MARALLFLTFFIIHVCTLYSQDLGPGKYSSHGQDSAGIKKYAAMGINLGTNSCYNGLTDKVVNADIGFNFDIYEVFDIGDKFTLEGGIGFIKFGGKNLGFGNKNLRNDTLFRFSNSFTGAFYFTVPLSVKYKYNDKSNFIAGVRICSMIMPYGSSVDGYIVKNVAYNTYLPVTNDALPSGSNTFDIGPILGYEYHFTHRLYASALLNIGLVPIFTQAYIDQNGTKYPIGAGNNNFGLSIGLSYDFLKN